jgi:hypothetical protein
VLIAGVAQRHRFGFELRTAGMNRGDVHRRYTKKKANPRRVGLLLLIIAGGAFHYEYRYTQHVFTQEEPVNGTTVKAIQDYRFTPMSQRVVSVTPVRPLRGEGVVLSSVVGQGRR